MFPPMSTNVHAGPLDQAALEAWGTAVGRAAATGDLPLPLTVALRGPLGAGKSVLARAIARGAGVRSPMPSPTYNLLFTYRPDDALTVHHLDLYRLEDPDDVWELGWRDLGEGSQLVLVEWPERAESLMPADRWDVSLTPVPGDPALRAIGIERRGGAPAVPEVAGP